jgi:uncharacterized membrane protein YfcA
VAERSALPLWFCYIRQCRWRARIIGSDIAHAAPLTLVAGVGHWIAGTVIGTILLSLLVGSPPGVIAGSRAAGWVPERGLRLTLATVLTIVGGKLAL